MFLIEYFLPRDIIKSPKRSFFVVLVGVETWANNVPNRTKNVPNRTKNVPNGTKKISD